MANPGTPHAAFTAVVVLALATAGCARNAGALIKTEGQAVDSRIVGLYRCGPHGHDLVDLDPARPVTVLVHGCNSSGARFKLLAEVFEAQGQQTLCFNYNDRDYLNTSATQLAAALSALQERLSPGLLTVIGHSQGGLVARRALQADLPHPLVTQPGFLYRLVTISAPFNGINASADCGKTWLHVLSLSSTVLVCLLVTGNKWPEIPPGSRFMGNPQPLVDTTQLQLVTDERETCRTRRADGSCAVDDFVFSVDEQINPLVSAQLGTRVVRLAAGHAAVVGENGEVPRLLIDTLVQEGVLSPIASPQRAPLDALLVRLYRR